MHLSLGNMAIQVLKLQEQDYKRKSSRLSRLLNNTMNTIQHNNTIQFSQKILKFYQIVLCYCVVLCCWFFSVFFLICSKNNTIQYNSIKKYNFCIKTLNFYKIVLCYCVVLCCCIFSVFF